MYIADGRKFFYQWDADREMIVTDPDITELHFCNGRSECSLVCEVKNGRACVPNILLQTAGNIRIYGFAKDHTEVAKIYKIFPRTKPEDYVYTETEVKRYETLAKEVEELKKQMGNLPTGGDIHRVAISCVFDMDTGGASDATFVASNYDEILSAINEGKFVYLELYNADTSALTMRLFSSNLLYVAPTDTEDINSFTPIIAFKVSAITGDLLVQILPGDNIAIVAEGV